MAATAVLNVRLPEELKEHGMQVLNANGISVSEIVRDLFSELEKTQTIPEFAMRNHDARDEHQRQRMRKRKAMAAMIGILPPDIDLDEARRERAEKHCFEGVRE